MEEGRTILHYKILSRLGEGGMGVVYRAEDGRLGRTVALKVLRRDLVAGEDWERRFQREVRAASAVTHPGIATIYDVQRDGETLFYTMEFVEGKNLRQLLEAGPLPLPLLLRGGLQIAEAMAEAHRKGIVHRDLKPENVVASDSGYFKILDFGLARFVTEDLAGPGGASRLETITRDTTQAGRLVGTVSYMSPEQAQGESIDARSDIFSIGSLLHELATGKAAFRKPGVIATFHAIVHEEPPPIRLARPEAPEELQWIVSRCLAKDRAHRYPTASELAEDLRSLAEISGSGSRRISSIRPYPPPRSARRRMVVAAGAAVALLAAVAGVWLTARSLRGYLPGSGALIPGGSGNPGATLPGSPAPAGQGTGSTGLSGSAPTARGDRFIAVATFANNSPDPKDAWLAAGIPQMLTTDLATSSSLKVISTQKVNDLLSMAGRKEIANLDGATATELARWAGAQVVVGGSVYKVGGSYRIDAQAFDAATGQVIAAGKAEGTNLFEMVNKVTADLRRGLLTTAEAAKGGSVQVATTSEDAYRQYSKGMDLYRELRYDEAADAFRKAIGSDAAFAPAQLRLGMSLYLNGNEDEGLRWIRKAGEGKGRLPERDHRLLDVLDAYLVRKNAVLADARVKAFEEAYPRDPEAALWKAQVAGESDGDHLAAIKLLRDILGQEPDNLAALSLLSSQVARLGRAEDAAAILREYLSRHPNGPGNLPDLIRKYSQGEPIPPPPAAPVPPPPAPGK